MKFYAIHEGFYEGVQVRIDQLKAACHDNEIEFILIDSLAFNYAEVPKLTKRDLLYNFARGSQTLESLLLNKNVTTFYVKNPELNLVTSTTEWAIIHEKAKIPAPKTIFNLSSNRQLLETYVNFLGGFPVVLKVQGGARGIGTIKVDSWPGLVSTIDYLITTGDRFIMREFITANGVGRCRVLGKEIIQSYEFPLIANDFRTASEPFETLKPVILKDFSDEIKNLCINAAHLANTEYAAVDFMIDAAGNPYILEVNFPAGLPLNWKESGNAIANKMIGYLKNKALKNGK